MTQPYPTDGPADVYSVPDVGASYDATGLATEAGNLSNMPVPSGGHPAVHSGISNPDVFEPGPTNTQPSR